MKKILKAIWQGFVWYVLTSLTVTCFMLLIDESVDLETISSFRYNVVVLLLWLFCFFITLYIRH